MNTDKRKTVLFLCTGNSCRSQMAEGWARHLKGDEIEPYSAGINPHGVDRRAVVAMAEEGVDISNHTSDHVDDFQDVDFDYVVTVCDHAREHCPVFTGGAAVVHESFEDPPWLAREAASDEDALPHYRRVRDQIRQFVEEMPQNLSNGT